MGFSSLYLFPCCQTHSEKALDIAVKPARETSFGIEPHSYYRYYKQCKICGHFYSSFTDQMNDLYQGRYVESTYKDSEGMLSKFHSINSFPYEKSDNKHRVERLSNLLENYCLNDANLLDVGGGLGVFPYHMKQLGWSPYVIEKDISQISHLKSIGLIHSATSLSDLNLKPNSFSLITFNKVLEHVLHPGVVLLEYLPYLNSSGFIYIEVPDGEAAYLESSRSTIAEEFFIEHFHVFSLKSLIQFNISNQLIVKHSGTIIEPSGKFTVWSLAQFS